MGRNGGRGIIKIWVLTDPFFCLPGYFGVARPFLCPGEKIFKRGVDNCGNVWYHILTEKERGNKMNYKERVLYNSLLFEQIKSILIAEELNIYDNSMVLKDIFGNCLKIEIFHFKNEESFETYKAIKKSAKLEEELKNRKKGEIK